MSAVPACWGRRDRPEQSDRHLNRRTEKTRRAQTGGGETDAQADGGEAGWRRPGPQTHRRTCEQADIQQKRMDRQASIRPGLGRADSADPAGAHSLAAIHPAQPPFLRPGQFIVPPHGPLPPAQNSPTLLLLASVPPPPPRGPRPARPPGSPSPLCAGSCPRGTVPQTDPNGLLRAVAHAKVRQAITHPEFRVHPVSPVWHRVRHRERSRVTVPFARTCPTPVSSPSGAHPRTRARVHARRAIAG